MSYHDKYIKYKNKYINALNLIKQNGGGKNPELIAFTAKWCGHCVKFKPLFDELKKDYSNIISFVNYDSEKDMEKIKEYKINGYPTLYLKHNNNLIEYSGLRNKDEILKFVKKNIKVYEK